MKTTVLILFAAGMFMLFSAISSGAGERSLSKNTQDDLQDCIDRIFLLEEKVESLETTLEKKSRTKSSFQKPGASFEKHGYPGKYYVPSLDTIECDY